MINLNDKKRLVNRFLKLSDEAFYKWCDDPTRENAIRVDKTAALLIRANKLIQDIPGYPYKIEEGN